MLPESFAKEFLEIEKERHKLHEQFIEKRIVGPKFIWDTIKIYRARSKPDLDLPGYLGKYEFSAAPISIFTEEGNLIR